MLQNLYEKVITIYKKNKFKQLFYRTKRGFLRGIFSRTTVIAALLILQILFLVATYRWFQSYQLQFELFEIVIIVITALYLVNSDMDKTAIITWLLVLIPFPIIGSLFLCYTKQDFGFKDLKAALKKTIKATQKYLVENQTVNIKQHQISGRSTTNYLKNTDGHFPSYHDTDITYFKSQEEQLEAVKECIQQARHFIFLEYFSIDQSSIWTELLMLLEQKAAEGVEIRMMYDGMGELSTLGFHYAKHLEKVGIKAKAFAPISPFISTYYNYRDYRNLIVVDGETAMTGSVDFSDNYLNRSDRLKNWKDSAIMLKGSGVNTFTILFLQLWSLDQANIDVEPYLNKEETQILNGTVTPYGDSPLSDDRISENVYIDILNQAKDYVYIMTPYLALDAELSHALLFAAKRDVEIKIIMPSITDNKLLTMLSKSYYSKLIKAGVEIYEYLPGFINAKVCLSDNEKAVVGTVNLDYRSLHHHFECATYMYRTKCIMDIASDFQETFSKCHLVSLIDVKNTPLLEKLLGIFIKALAPLL